MKIFRCLLIFAWLLVTAILFYAMWAMGLSQGVSTFFGDFSHLWRAQFNGDFSVHLLLMGGWIVYREKVRWVGLLCGFLAVFWGGAFSFLYIVIASFRVRGNVERLLLGHHFPNAA
jgi:hypothetical protein